MTDNRPVVYQRPSFLSTAALGVCAVLITCVVSCTVVVVYGIQLASDNTDDLFALAEKTVQTLPELAKSLPPAVGDLLNDRRDPGYAGRLEVRATLAACPDRQDCARTVFDIVNKGQNVVSLLSLRVTVLDDQGRILHESNEWAATPLAADHDWRGPLMPGSHRRFNGSLCRIGFRQPLEDLIPEVEITDIRVWNPDRQAEPTAETPAA